MCLRTQNKRSNCNKYSSRLHTTRRKNCRNINSRVLQWLLGIIVVALAVWLDAALPRGFWTFIIAKTVKNRAFYDLLGVDPSATLSQIKKGYRTLAVKYHPDAMAANAVEGSESELEAANKRFMEINRAYEVLSNEKTRAIYDRYGEEGLDPNFSGQRAGPQGFPGQFHSFPGGFSGGFPGGFSTFNFGGSGGTQRFVFTTSGGGNSYETFFRTEDFPFGGRASHGSGGSQSDIYTDDSPVMKLTNDLYSQTVTSRDRAVLVNLYNPSCPPCRQFRSEYETLARALNEAILVSAINCQTQRSLCSKLNPSKFPHLLLFPHDKRRPSVEFRGTKFTAAAVKQWIESEITVECPILSSVEDLNSWISKTGTTAGISLPRVVFFAKTVVPLLIRRVVVEFENKISFAVVLRGTTGGKALVSSEFPSIPTGIEGSGILHVLNLDDMSGNWTVLQNEITRAQVIKRFRSILEKHSASRGVAQFTRMTPRQWLSGACGPQDGQICFLLITEVGSPGPGIGSRIQRLVEKFSRDPVRFYWIDLSTIKSGFLEAFDVKGSPIRSCTERDRGSEMKATFIAYRPKKQRYKVLEDCTKLETFVESTVTGGTSLTNRLTQIPILSWTANSSHFWEL